MQKFIFGLISVLAMGCGDGELDVEDYHGTNAGTNNTATTGGSDTTTVPSNSGTDNPPASSSNGSSNGSTNNATVPSTNNAPAPSTNNATAPMTNNGTNVGPQFHPMFVAVADFMREKCISCHSEGQNGNFQIPSATSTNEEVRVALEGVESTRGLLLVEPGNPEQSQVYIMITNDAGEQFPPETIAIVEDWIVAGAPYVE